jgi:hypothetical protein
VRNILLAATLALAIIAPAFSAEAPPAQTPEPPRTATVIPKPQFTLNECMTIQRGLKALDGNYKFGNGALRGTLGQNQARLQEVATEIDQARQKIFAEIAKGAPEIKPTIQDENKKEQPNPDFVEYNKQLMALGESPCHATLIHFKRDDLKLDVNEIPGSALADVDRIMDK